MTEVDTSEESVNGAPAKESQNDGESDNYSRVGGVEVTDLSVQTDSPGGAFWQESGEPHEEVEPCVEKAEADGDAAIRGSEKEEDEGDCPFCVYMMSGVCRERFAEWEECTNEAEKAGESIVEKCAHVTRFLTHCMRANLDHYGPVLDAEKAVVGAADLQAAAVATDHDQAEREALEV